MLDYVDLKITCRKDTGVKKFDLPDLRITHNLKGHCHGDLAVFWSKLPKYLTKPFCLHEIALKTPRTTLAFKGFLQGRTN